MLTAHTKGQGANAKAQIPLPFRYFPLRRMQSAKGGMQMPEGGAQSALDGAHFPLGGVQSADDVMQSTDSVKPPLVGGFS